MRHVFATMGTMASLATERAVDFAAVERLFDVADRRFSLYRADSDLSRIASGDLRLPDASAEVLALYAESLDWRTRTDGAFTPNRPDGAIDLNGIVKAATMRDAGALLDAAGGAWSLVVGGDVFTSASAAADVSPRRAPIGIVDPFDRGALVGAIVLTGTRRAVATSGSAERGDHIWLGGRPAPADFVQVTVVADEIVTADVLATAAVAGGREGLDDLCDRWPIDILAIDRSGALVATPGLRAALAAA